MRVRVGGSEADRTPALGLEHDEAGGEALTVLNLDSVPPEELLAEIRQDDAIANVQVVRL